MSVPEMPSGAPESIDAAAGRLLHKTKSALAMAQMDVWNREDEFGDAIVIGRASGLSLEEIATFGATDVDYVKSVLADRGVK